MNTQTEMTANNKLLEMIARDYLDNLEEYSFQFLLQSESVELETIEDYQIEAINPVQQTDLLSA